MSTKLSKAEHFTDYEFQIDPEFRDLIPPLTAEEREYLKISLLAEGCRDPLVMWAETGILVDGHNRYEICTAHTLPFPVVRRSFPNRAAVKAWMIDTQLGRRNLTPMLASYLRGVQYLLEKHQGKRHDLTSDHFDQKLETATRLSLQYQVSAPTIRRDAEYATAIDTIAQIVGSKAKAELLSRQHLLPKKKVLSLAIAAKSAPDTVRQFFNKSKPEPVLEVHSPTAQHLKLNRGGLVEVFAPGQDSINGRYGRIERVGEKTVDVWLRNLNTMTMQLHTFKVNELTPLPLESQPSLKAVCERLAALLNSGQLDPFELELVNLLERPVAHTPTEMQYLLLLEDKYLALG
jgi:hypothetical protein